MQFPKELKLFPNKTLNIGIRAKKDDLAIKEKIEVQYEVKNLLVSPSKHLIKTFSFDFESLKK